MMLGKPFKPMDPVLVDEIFDNPRWAYQVKWDGVRILAHVQRQGIELFNKRLNRRTDQYPEMQEIIQSAVGKREALLDGEMIALRNGKPNFYDLIRRDWSTSPGVIKALVSSIPVCYMLFDILYLDGKELRSKSWEERQSLLQNNIKISSQLVITDVVYEHGETLFEAVKTQGLEGVVAKERHSKYLIGGKNKLWQKIKVMQQLNCLVGGYTVNSGLAALLLGVFSERGLIYIGRVNAALKSTEKGELLNFLKNNVQKDSPFINKTSGKGIYWVKPYLPILVEFLEWTDDLKLRHPKIIGFSGVKPNKCTLQK
ncbi:non-homologous end-joining DNA ligase [Metallumcola ferriviriculae]|uniref:DNA ligase (ATP) n=1 Tax=Metallumcola ferriviriculae TaxID=3039180 RepID=A0AAU0UIV5_9FIRM|nr:non-homologous end-joining DNA ligase [Desulfitibacteraceae bacterium MK1]